MSDRKASTSIPEQAIYYYLKQYYSDAQNRYRFRSDNGNTYEADIYIPSEKTIIEYDGEYWHANKAKKDEEKRQFFAENGLFIIIVREGNLPTISVNNGVVLQHGTKATEGLHMNEVITEIIHVVGERSNNIQQMSFSLTYEQYCDDYSDILKGIFTKPVKENVTQSCAFSCWDHEKNKGINPLFIPCNTSAKFWYRCPDGHSFRTAPREWNKKRNCDMNCSKCAYHVCPFLTFCPPYMEFVEYHFEAHHKTVIIPEINHMCQYIQDFIFGCVFGREEWPQKYASQIQFRIKHSEKNNHINMELNRLYNQEDATLEVKQRIYEIQHYIDDLSDGTGYLSQEAKNQKMKEMEEIAERERMRPDRKPD